MRTLFVFAMMLGSAVPAFADSGTSKASAPWRVAQNQNTQTVGLRVALGDKIETVRATYNITTAPIPTANRQVMFKAPRDGLIFFFDENELTLHNIRADAPFAGSINGVRIGDTFNDVVAKLGRPSTDAWDFGDNKAYVFDGSPNSVRCDFDNAKKVVTLFTFVNLSLPGRVAPTQRFAPPQRTQRVAPPQRAQRVLPPDPAPAPEVNQPPKSGGACQMFPELC